MNKNKKRLIYIASGSALIVVLLIVLKLIIDLPYRSELPVIPDLQGSSRPLAEQILKASKKARRNPSSENLGNLGMVYHSSANYDQAASCYRLAARRNKSEWIWSYYLGYLNTEMGESNAAIECFRTVIKTDPEIYQAWYYVGEGYENMGESYKAEVAFQKIANLQDKRGKELATTRNDYFPLRAYAMFQLARIYISSDRVDMAEQTLKQIIQFHRSFGAAYRLLGNAYRLKGDSTLSKYNIVRANDLADFTPPVDTLIDKLALMSRSEMYLLKQIDIAEKSIYPEWALAIANNGVKQLPENKYLISKLLKLLLRLDFGEKALPYLDNHIFYYNDDFTEIKEVADLLYEKGLNSQALVYYNRASSLKPGDAEVQSSLAMCLWNEGMHTDASAHIIKMLERENNNAEAFAAGVMFFIKAGERDNAVMYINRLKQIAPENPKSRKLSGMIADSDGKIQEAIALYESSFNGDPADKSTIRYLGNILLKQKMWVKAEAHYRKALQFHPNEPDFLERLGTLLVVCPDIKVRNYKDAKEFSERAFIHTDCPAEVLISAAKSLAESYGALGDSGNAYTFFNITINLAKNQNAPKEFISDLEKKLKFYSTAK
jgi:tetratricopeptide (TPR) repeat protein